MKALRLLSLGVLLAAAAPRALPAQAAMSGPKADMLAQFDDAANKILQLAQAIPQDKFTWRPAQGVRSVSEVVLHVAGGNYFVLGFAGLKAPDGAMVPDSVTDKARVIAALQRSMEFTRASLRAYADANMDKMTTMFGQQSTNRNVWLTLVSHNHEHLGQLIAYARSNGIAPPWSMGQ